jgi:hypothetical protein
MAGRREVAPNTMAERAHYGLSCSRANKRVIDGESNELMRAIPQQSSTRLMQCNRHEKERTVGGNPAVGVSNLPLWRSQSTRGNTGRWLAGAAVSVLHQKRPESGRFVSGPDSYPPAYHEDDGC